MAFLVIVEDGSFFAVTSCRRATDTPGARLSAKGPLLQELHCMLERDIVSVSFSHLPDETWWLPRRRPVVWGWMRHAHRSSGRTFLSAKCSIRRNSQEDTLRPASGQ